ncbi:MAG: hypothetical protein PHP86_19790 [Nevskiales bacterium]|nr:hypothetical protein [Nevskiales bacterium]
MDNHSFLITRVLAGLFLVALGVAAGFIGFGDPTDIAIRTGAAMHAVASSVNASRQLAILLVVAGIVVICTSKMMAWAVALGLAALVVCNADDAYVVTNNSAYALTSRYSVVPPETTGTRPNMSTLNQSMFFDLISTTGKTILQAMSPFFGKDLVKYAETHKPAEVYRVRVPKVPEPKRVTAPFADFDDVDDIQAEPSAEPPKAYMFGKPRDF